MDVKPNCLGCKEGQMNQEAHYSGCLLQTDEDNIYECLGQKILKKKKIPIFKPNNGKNGKKGKNGKNGKKINKNKNKVLQNLQTLNL